MRPLPPTLRQNRRYVLIEVMTTADDALTQKEMYLACASAVRDLFGDVGSSRIHPAVIWSEGAYAIVRCSRGTEMELTAALACVVKAGPYSNGNVRFRTIRTSGTVLGAKKGIPPERKNILPENE